jgi:hypothetical protein
MASFTLRPNIASGVGRYSPGLRRNSSLHRLNGRDPDSGSDVQNSPTGFGQLIHRFSDKGGWSMFVACAQHERVRTVPRSARNLSALRPAQDES